MFDTGHPESFLGMDAIFIDLDGELVPFFLETFQVRDDHTAIVKLEDISSDEQAKKLVNSALYLPSDDPVLLRQKPSRKPKVIGFKVYDLSKGYIGEVEDVIAMKEQDLLKIMHLGKEILIPAVEAIIIRIDNKKKEIRADLPEGLLDINP